ncbi:MAG: helicase-related protein [Candidatus Peregrinibacteria bacterium]
MTTNSSDNDGKNSFDRGTDVPGRKEFPAKRDDAPGVVRQEVTQALHETVTHIHGTERREVGNRELPIWRRMPEIVEALRHSGVLILTSETGSGKSTQVPQALLAEGFAEDGKTIIVVQNRVAVAVEVAKRVADELGVEVGTLVGYLTGPEKKAGKKSKILFVTAGVFRNMLRHDPTMEQASVVLFDEFDERELLMDLGTALMEKSQTRDGTSKFCLMSATLNAQKFSEHFGKAPIVEAKGRPFPVQTHFAQESIDQRRMPETAAQIALSIHQSSPAGDILIFMPGKQEINETTKVLEKARIAGATILPLHSELKPEERHRVFKRVRGRKIIISTNIAERGVTIDGVKYVIDSGLARMTQYDAASDTTKLAITQCAQDALVQRRGRAGRTQPGECHCLYSERDFQERDRSTKPEIQRTSLREVVMQIKAMGYSREDDPIRLIDAPEKQSWKAAKNQLRLLGALDPADETKLSEFGEQLAELPCDPREGTIILKGCQMGCGKEAALIAAIRTGRRLFYRPQAEGEKADTAHARFCTSNRSDLLNLIQVYREAEANGFSDVWCRANYVSWLALKEIRQNYDRILGQLRSMGLPLNKEDSTPDVVCRAIATGFPDKIYKRVFMRGCTNIQTGHSASIGRESSVRGVMIAAHDVIELPRITIMPCCTEVNLKLLAQDMPHLVHETEKDLYWNHDRQAVYAHKHMMVGSASLSEDYVPASRTPESVRMFCKNFASGSHVHHEIVTENRRIVRESEMLHVRSGGSTRKLTEEDVIRHYERILLPYDVNSIQTLNEASIAGLDLQSLRLTEEAFTNDEQKERVMKDNPERLECTGLSIPVAYYQSAYTNEFHARIELPVEQILSLSLETIAKLHIPSGRTLYLFPSGDYQSSIAMNDPEKAMQGIASLRKRIAWESFGASHRPVVIPFTVAYTEPPLPNPVIYDPSSGARARPYFNYKQGGDLILAWTDDDTRTDIAALTEGARESVRQFGRAQAEATFQRAETLLSACERDLHGIIDTDTHPELADLVAGVQQRLSTWDRQTAEVPLRTIEDLQGITVRIQAAREEKLRREAEAQLAVVEHAEPEQTEVGGSSGLFGQLLEQARSTGSACVTLGGKIKREVPPHVKAEGTSAGAAKVKKNTFETPALTFRPLSTMTGDEQLQEYEENDQVIRQIIAADPDIDAVAAELAGAEAAMEEVQRKLENGRRNRDTATEKKRQRKAEEFLEEQEAKRTELKERLRTLKHRVQQVQKQKERLDALRVRQTEIEAII